MPSVYQKEATMARNTAALGNVVAALLAETDIEPCSTPIEIETVGATGHGDCWMVTMHGVIPGTSDDLRRRVYLRYDGVEISRWEQHWTGSEMGEWRPIQPPRTEAEAKPHFIVVRGFEGEVLGVAGPYVNREAAFLARTEMEEGNLREVFGDDFQWSGTHDLDGYEGWDAEQGCLTTDAGDPLYDVVEAL